MILLHTFFMLIQPEFTITANNIFFFWNNYNSCWFNIAVKLEQNVIYIEITIGITLNESYFKLKQREFHVELNWFECVLTVWRSFRDNICIYLRIIKNTYPCNTCFTYFYSPLLTEASAEWPDMVSSSFYFENLM